MINICINGDDHMVEDVYDEGLNKVWVALNELYTMSAIERLMVRIDILIDVVDPNLYDTIFADIWYKGDEVAISVATWDSTRKIPDNPRLIRLRGEQPWT